MSKFAVGTEVALIYTGTWGDRQIHKRTVAKVRRDGKFFLNGFKEGEVSDKMWSPSKVDDGLANRAGKDRYSREHIRVWSGVYDEELREKTVAREAGTSRVRAEEFLKRLDPRNPDDRAKIAQVLAILVPEEKGTMT